MMMGKNIAAADLVALVAVLTCTSFLAQLGEAVNWRIFSSSKTPNELNHLNEISQSFYDIFLKPLVKKCANDDFDTEILENPSPIVKAEKDRFCGNVKNMNKLLIEVNELEKKKILTKNRKNKKLGILEKIRKLVFDDLVDLKADYDKLLSDIDIKSIEEEVINIAGKRTESEHKEKEFKKSVEALEQELNKTPTAAEGQNISGADKLAYKMLMNGEGIYIYHGTFELEWAYRQFGANALVYALRLDVRKSNWRGETEMGGIQGIAHGWLVHSGVVKFRLAFDPLSIRSVK